MNSCIYEGWTRHRRFEPIEHAFRYRLFLMYLDLSELTEVFRGRWLWSTRRTALAQFRRDDHLGPADVPLDQAVRDLVEAEGLPRPSGPIRLLTHLRYFGYVFNPVSFYYCFQADGCTLQSVVAEVHNTPWKERHCYVLSPEHWSNAADRPLVAKQFHVSPFMPMEMAYRWRLTEPAEQLSVHIESLQESVTRFDCTLQLSRRGLSPGNLRRVLWRFPWMTARVSAAIYWQALQLRRKGCPFYPHPRKRRDLADPALETAEAAPRTGVLPRGGISERT